MEVLLDKNNRIIIPTGSFKEKLEYVKFVFQKLNWTIIDSDVNYLDGKICKCVCLKHGEELELNPKRSDFPICRKCSIEKRNQKNTRSSEEGMRLAHEMASSKNGKCLSKVYTGYNQIMEWKCDDSNHPTFKSKWTPVVKQGRWCPYCANDNRRKGKSTELKIKRIFEIALKENFPTVRPEWNTNEVENHPYMLEVEKEVLKIKKVQKKKNPLELDGYSEKLSLAFEYQGLQHYELAPFFSAKNSYTTLSRIVINDWLKIQNCARENVTLIIIPQCKNIHTFDTSKLLKYINKFANTNGINLELTRSEINILNEEFEISKKSRLKNRAKSSKKTIKTPEQMEKFGLKLDEFLVGVIENVKKEIKSTNTTDAIKEILSSYKSNKEVIEKLKSCKKIRSIKKIPYKKSDIRVGFKLPEKDFANFEFIKNSCGITNKSDVFREAILRYHEYTTIKNQLQNK